MSITLRENLVAVREIREERTKSTGIIVSRKECSLKYGEVVLIGDSISLDYIGKMVIYNEEIGTIYPDNNSDSGEDLLVVLSADKLIGVIN